MISHLLTVIYSNTYTHQNYEGKLSFATDAWTSPNYKAYVAVTVHFEQDGVLISSATSGSGSGHKVAHRAHSCSGICQDSRGLWHRT